MRVAVVMSSILPTALLLALLLPLVHPQHEWRSDGDLSKLYDTATPSPTGSLSGPWFDMGHSNVSDVHAIKGRTAHLACRIINLGNRTVSWLRHRDTHLLTIGLFTYTPDRRFSAIHKSSSVNWVLEIRDVRAQDAGLYECQVSSTPVRGHVVRLEVTEAKISVEGGSEVHIRTGSEFTLACRIEDYPDNLAYVWWYKDDHRLATVDEEMKTDDHVSVEVRKESSGDSVSQLHVVSASEWHRGNYTCRSEAGISQPVAVHVITGETRAGLQVNKAHCSSLTSSTQLLLAILLQLGLLRFLY